MKNLLLILLACMTACGGSLSSDERKKLHDASKLQEVVRVTEAEIDEAVLAQGRTVTEQAMRFRDDPARLDSLGHVNHAAVRWVTSGAPDALSVEQQIIEAYVMNPAEDLPDNVQWMGEDSVLYSRPQVSKLPDGAIMVDGMWSVVFSKKDIILGMRNE